MSDRCFADTDEYVEEVVEDIKPVNKVASSNKALCPECGEEITFEGGCNICKSCGWSKCD
jgi:ribonucleoside-diphosphate reductase alpha chain